MRELQPFQTYKACQLSHGQTYWICRAGIWSRQGLRGLTYVLLCRPTPWIATSVVHGNHPSSPISYSSVPRLQSIAHAVAAHTPAPSDSQQILHILITAHTHTHAHTHTRWPPVAQLNWCVYAGGLQVLQSQHFVNYMHVCSAGLQKCTQRRSNPIRARIDMQRMLRSIQSWVPCSIAVPFLRMLPFLDCN